MKILVTGGTGLLGYWLVKEFIEHGYNVYATYYTKPPVIELPAKWIKLNLENQSDIVDIIRSAKPDVIIHAAAYTDVDGCEVRRDYAYFVNVIGTRTLAFMASKYDIKVVYISTDYVFDGEKGMYREEDIPCPINFYGLTKLLGEEAVLATSSKNVVVRVSGLYGYSPTGKKNFGIIALEALVNGKEVKAFTDQLLSPTYVPELAKVLVKLLETDYHGVIHIAGERMSRYEFVIRLAEVGGFEKSLIKPISIKDVKLIAKRPRDSSLSLEKAKEFNLTLPDTHTCLKMFIETYRKFIESKR